MFFTCYSLLFMLCSLPFRYSVLHSCYFLLVTWYFLLVTRCVLFVIHCNLALQIFTNRTQISEAWKLSLSLYIPWNYFIIKDVAKSEKVYLLQLFFTSAKFFLLAYIFYELRFIATLYLKPQFTAIFSLIKFLHFF